MQRLVYIVSDCEDCIDMNIEAELEMHNQILCLLGLHKLDVESYCVLSWKILLAVPNDVDQSFFESVAVLRLVFCEANFGISNKTSLGSSCMTCICYKYVF